MYDMFRRELTDWGSAITDTGLAMATLEWRVVLRLKRWPFMTPTNYVTWRGTPTYMESARIGVAHLFNALDARKVFGRLHWREPILVMVQLMRCDHDSNDIYKHVCAMR